MSNEIYLYLEKGQHFKGSAYGAPLIDPVLGEIVFNTSMSGYQEIISDPSYCDQLLIMTSPLIGNVGINSYDFESMKISLKALIVHELQDDINHWQANTTVDQLFKEKNLPILSNIDTRALTRIIRDNGSMKAVLSHSELSPSTLNTLFKKNLPIDQIKKVSTQSPLQFPGTKERVVLIDYGYKKNILKSILNYQLDVVVVPYHFNLDQILNYRPKGIVLSNGPGDPKDVPEVLETIVQLQQRLPVLGICMGHQLFALANGAQTYKLPFGHRGANHPVKDLILNRVFMSSQNHGYAVDLNNFPAENLEVTQVNLNDGSIEGLQHKKYQAFSVQYHPEAAPGPTDTSYIFEKFYSLFR